MNDARHDDAATSRTVLRREDGRFVTGRGRYTDDINIPGQAYVTFVRSDHAHGELLSIDMAEASRQPGVLRVFTGDDLARAGVGFIHRLPAQRFRSGSDVGHAPAGSCPRS